MKEKRNHKKIPATSKTESGCSIWANEFKHMQLQYTVASHCMGA